MFFIYFSWKPCFEKILRISSRCRSTQSSFLTGNPLGAVSYYSPLVRSFLGILPRKGDCSDGHFVFNVHEPPFNSRWKGSKLHVVRKFFYPSLNSRWERSKIRGQARLFLLPLYSRWKPVKIDFIVKNPFGSQSTSRTNSKFSLLFSHADGIMQLEVMEQCP